MEPELTRSQKHNIARRKRRIPRTWRDAKGEFPWRNSRQLAGMEGVLQGEINRCHNGSEITLDITSARNLLEIVRQAKHTEVGHGVYHMPVSILATEDMVNEVLASPHANMTGVMEHPMIPHHYIIVFADAKNTTICHRVLDAAQMIRYAHNILCIVDHSSVDYMSVLIQLGNAEGQAN